MRPREDIVGRRFGFLVVLGFAKMTDYGASYWLCRCRCGKEKMVQRSNLISGRIQSCGCSSSALMSLKNTRHGAARGGKRTREYEAWIQAKQRCTNPTNANYERYGGRGIKMCDRWLNSFENFLADMGPVPKGLSLDRRDNNGDYCKANCRWATNEEQMNNTRVARIITIDGESLSISQWARRIGITPAGLTHRIEKSNWPHWKIFSAPSRKNKIAKSVNQQSKETGKLYGKLIYDFVAPEDKRG